MKSKEFTDSTAATFQGLLDEHYGKGRIYVTLEGYGLVCRFAGGCVVITDPAKGIGGVLEAGKHALDRELARGPLSYIPMDLSWLEPLRDLVEQEAIAPEEAQVLFQMAMRPAVCAPTGAK